MLEAERAQLRTQLGQAVVLPYEGGFGYGNHMADDATEAFEQAKGLALLERLRRALKDTEDALSKYETGTYGLCERCGQEIDWARLEAIPSARYCLVCQQHQEIA